MNNVKIVFSCLLLCMLAFVSSTWAQVTQTYNGVVMDAASGEPLIGVNITQKGTTTGTITDVDGKFTIRTNEGVVLSISYIGYEAQEVRLGKDTELRISLNEDQNQLDEVVVIGYGVVKKSDLTGSVSSVSTKQYKEQPVKRVSEILQGRVTGVQVTNTDGMPGGGVKIRVRGTTSINTGCEPLYVTDGVIGGGLDMNPDDIASIEVLKDASATAIYGSRGANGVILITTKKGTEGKPRISVEANIGISNIIKKYDLLSPYEYAQALNYYRGGATISDEDMEAYRTGQKGIDWQEKMLQTGVSQNYKVSISGGSKKNRYYISANFLDQSAMTITTKNQRSQMRINLDNELTDRLAMSTKLNMNYSHLHNGDIDMMTFLNYSPTMEMRDPETGIYNKDPYNAVDSNPYGRRIENYSDSYNYGFSGNMNFTYKIIDGLTFSAQGSLSYSHSPNYNFSSALTAPGALSAMSNSSSHGVTWQNIENVTYDKFFNKDHHLTATAVFELNGYEGKSLSIGGSDLNNEFVGYWNVNNAKNITAGNGYSASSMVSALGRVMYSYKGRYMATATLRADGSSKFSKGNKWGYFPSVALAWNVVEERFMKNQKIFDQLKLRASFGVSGNSDIGSYSTLGTLSEKNYDSWGSGQIWNGYWSGSLSTPDVTWESTYQYNVGVDVSVLSGRLNFTAEWFRKDTKDLLLRKPIPSYNGGGSFWVNNGEIRNRGVEFNLAATPVATKNLRWETSFNASWLHNEVIDLAGDPFIVGENLTGFGAGPIEIKKVGHPIGSFYVYEWQNFSKDGLNLYKHQADGSFTTTPTSDDLVVKGQAEPSWTFGWNNTVTWKNWTFNCFFNAALGSDRLNMSRFAMSSMVGKYKFITLADAYYKSWDMVENKTEALYSTPMLS